MAICSPGGLKNLFIGGVKISVGDVFTDGAVEQKWLLTDDRNVSPQRLERGLGDALAVDGDFAVAGLVKRRKEVDEGGFAGAGRPDKRGHLARLGDESDVVQRRLVVGVVELHSAVFDLAKHRLWQRAIGRGGFSFLGGIEDVKDALPAGPGGLQHLVQPVQLANRFVKQGEIK